MPRSILILLAVIVIHIGVSAQVEKEVQIKIHDTIYFDECQGDVYEHIDLYKKTRFEQDTVDFDSVDGEAFYEDQGKKYFYQGKERYDHLRQWDIRKLEYTYTYVDFQAAAKGSYLESDRAEYLVEKTRAIYPDTLVWIRDFTYSYNEPMTRQYYNHPKYDDYPVVGINWHQANAFCNYRTQWLNRYWSSQEMPITEYWICILGEDLTPEIVKDVYWPTSNRIEEIIWLTEDYIQLGQILISLTTTVYITWRVM